jgi:hypothetical protein
MVNSDVSCRKAVGYPLATKARRGLPPSTDSKRREEGSSTMLCVDNMLPRPVVQTPYSVTLIGPAGKGP